MSYFLGIQASKLPNGNIHLSQRKYILDLLIRANMQNAKPIATPMIGGHTLSAHGSDPVMDTQLYRSIVGALQYATITRPQITYSVNKVCQFMQSPLLSHWRVVKRILRYLAGTLDSGLFMQSNPKSSMKLEGFCDADCASDPDNRRFTSGFCVFLGSNLIS